MSSSSVKRRLSGDKFNEIQFKKVRQSDGNIQRDSDFILEESSVSASSSAEIIGRCLPKLSCSALISKNISSVSLNSYAGRWLCLIFYPLDFDGSDSASIIQHCSKRHAEFDALNCDVLFCSTDSCYAHLAWSSMAESAGGLGGALHYPLLADQDHSLCSRFGLLVPSKGVARRALVIIDPKQTVQQVLVTKSGVGGSVDSVVRAVKHLQQASA